MHGRFDRRERRGRRPARRTIGAGPHHRDHPRGLRQPLPKQAVQSGIPAHEEPARAAVVGGTAAHARHSVRMTAPYPLVSTAWLAEHLDAPDVRVADASWYLPQASRDARAEYRSAHIPGAVFFDIDDLSDETSKLPHMLPSPVKFASRMRKLGLGDGNLIVVYDGAGIYSAARAWWMLRAMGHQDVAVLDGGLPKW